MLYDVIIIGSGPTGASAAIFCAKAGKKTLVIDQDQSITKRAWIENHYGVMEIAGPDLVETGRKQAAKFGAEMVQGAASSLHAADEGEGISVETAEGSYTGKHVIIASGLSMDFAEQSGIATKPGTEPRVKAVIDVDSAGKTNVDGVWAAGACAGTSLHTIITAGDGAKVAINVISELNGTRYVDHDVLKS